MLFGIFPPRGTFTPVCLICETIHKKDQSNFILKSFFLGFKAGEDFLYNLLTLAPNLANNIRLMICPLAVSCILLMVIDSIAGTLTDIENSSIRIVEGIDVVRLVLRSTG